MSNKLRDQLNDFLKEAMSGDKKKPSLEEIFQETLDITTPAQPGDVRRAIKKEKKEESEWL